MQPVLLLRLDTNHLQCTLQLDCLFSGIAMSASSVKIIGRQNFSGQYWRHSDDNSPLATAGPGAGLLDFETGVQHRAA